MQQLSFFNNDEKMFSCVSQKLRTIITLCIFGANSDCKRVNIEMYGFGYKWARKCTPAYVCVCVCGTSD